MAELCLCLQNLILSVLDSVAMEIHKPNQSANAYAIEMDSAKSKFQEDRYTKIVREIVLRNIEKDRYHVFLFGSRADKTCNFSSDINIGIIGEQPLGKLYYKIINGL